tara:strand:+ start:3560 stop:4480 length:921 start_codon:yes stop_codon:yes gene_type:complete
VKILVISSNLIGDTVLSTCVIEHFYKNYPNSRFTFVVGPTASQIFENFPRLENIIKINKKKFNLHWLEIYLKNRHIQWDIIIDLRSSLLSFFFNTKKRYIFKKSKNLHQIEQLKKSFKINAEFLNVYTNQFEEKKASEKIKKDIKHIVIFPGGNWIPKIWPIENYNILLKTLCEKYLNIKFIIVGSNIEKKIYLEKIKNGISDNKFIDIMGETLTLTSAYMKKSNLFIGNDSGLMHLSVASKLPTIALFGPTDDKRYGHKNENCYVIRTKKTFDDFKKIKINKEISYMESIDTCDILNVISKNDLL